MATLVGAIIKPGLFVFCLFVLNSMMLHLSIFFMDLLKKKDKLVYRAFRFELVLSVLSCLQYAESRGWTPLPVDCSLFFKHTLNAALYPLPAAGLKILWTFYWEVEFQRITAHNSQRNQCRKPLGTVHSVGILQIVLNKNVFSFTA